MSLGFERPFLAIASPFIIALAVFIGSRLKNQLNFSVPLGAPGGVPFKPPQNIEGFVRALRVLEYCGALLLLLSAAGPLVKSVETVWLDRGADVLFVIDTSPSMAALDMNGTSRFNAARALIVSFAKNRPSDGIGLAALGSDAALLVPPTTDRQALVTRIEQLRVGELGDGTALGDGLATAAFHLEKSKAPRRAVVLLTDGENNAGAIHPQTAAAMLADLQISLYIVGIGSGGEVPIDYVDPYTKMRRTGVFDSRFNMENLRVISNAGGGTLLPAPSAEALDTAFARIGDQELVVRRSGFVTRKRSCRLPFMLTALGLLAGLRFIRRFFLGGFS
jgi:Ca-activated chloride channel family protein